ncbi:acyltransferase family protein [Ornithinicoccus hortensis]|uniref:acyltransferase family protein n=1 Tax=Ornithinicoccus hortensis TaxID=82346 RepID=UPI001153B616|nr:acyltransferase family protein [Ornithinicoccus hortensis]
MTTSDPRPQDVTGSRFRRDVEGLRALAVILVLLHHTGLAVPSGGFLGVDVFFVVSGFVITMQLLREVDAEGRVSLLRFYGRRAKRLLPAAAVVLVVTAVAAWLMVSRVRWESIAGDIAASALYVVNWVFAARSVDYLAEDVDPSPVLHFWSLAVEEQFYIVWPLVILGLVWLARRRQRRIRDRAVRSGLHRSVSDRPGRAALALGMAGLIVLPSLAWSLYYTAQSPEQAFFVTPTRLWELGVGALVAIGAGAWERCWQWVGGLLGWVGLAAVIGSALVVDTGTAWPGWAALVPVLGTAAVIVGGFNAAPWGPLAVLGLGPAVWVGGLSYSLYLWHWPALRIAEWQWGELTPWAGLAVVLASVLPAWLSYRLVERPIRYAEGLRTSPRFALSVGLNASLAGLLSGVLLGLAAASSVPSPGTAQVQPGNLDGSGRGTTGSAVLGAELGSSGPGDPGGGTAGGDVEADPGPVPPSAEDVASEPLVDQLTPDPVVAVEDGPPQLEGCLLAADEVDLRDCTAGDPDGDTDIALVGDSKAGQWLPALDAIGRENGWRIRVYTKSACAFTDAMTSSQGEPYETCREWGQAVFEELSGPARPDVLITSSVRGTARGADDADTANGIVEGFVGYWQPLIDGGTTVVALSDTPQPGGIGPVYECVAEHPEDFELACSWPYETSAGSTVLREAVDRIPQGAHFVDMDPWVCPDGTCIGVYRNVLTYRAGSHITATYVMVLAEPLAEFLVPLIEDPEVSRR